MKKLLSLITLLFIGSIAFSQITITSTVTNVSCFGGNNGSATITATGGTGAYTYTWLPTGTASPNVLTNVAAGQYTVIVADAVANTNSLVINIGQPTQLTVIAVAQSSAACWCNGSASVTVTGGNPPYAYNWNVPFGGNMPQVTNLCPGITQVNITDANGCVAITTVAISAPPPINITSTVTNASCQNSCNGSINATVTGGTPGYTYTWTTSGPFGGGGGTASIYAACAGIYTLVVTDAAGCVQVLTTNVAISTNNSLPNATVTNTSYNETCHLTGDGAIDVTITGSNPGPFTYQWSNGANTQDITNIISNIYFLSITDGSANCITIKDTISSIGINCGTINGNVYIDNNSDCVKNSGDNDYQNTIVLINPGNRIGYTNMNGSYVINSLPYGTYSVTLITSTNTPVFPNCTTTLNATVNSGNQNSINNNLSVGFNSTTNPDLRVSAYSNGIVPGFGCYVNYQLTNLNNVSASGLFKAVLPSAFISNITTGNPNTYAVSGDTVIWNFTNVTYSAGTSFYIYFNVPLITPLGSLFTTCMLAQPSISDFNYINNTLCYSRQVTGSFDPNDKTVSPVGVGANGDIAATETDLTYLIRFQNTGNGPAVNIVVKDTLSPNVDINTFEMLGASHNYNIDILPGNVLRWKFNNIMLADSGSNEPASHGYIQYRIKRNNNNTPGTIIKNTAYIYFDFNEPVVTNTAINTIETITGIKSSFNTNDGWNVYPNPSTGVLYIVNSSSVKEASQIQVINSIGQTVLEETITSNYKNIDLSKLNNGVYFVKIVSEKQSSVKRVVLSR